MVRRRLLILWRCLQIIFGHFFLVTILLFVTFIIFVLVVPWFFFHDFLATFFLEMSGLVTVATFWYVCTFFMPEVIWLVSIFPASCAGTLVLGFYVKDFFIFYWHFGLSCLFIWSYLSESLSLILSIVKWLSSSSNLYSIISTKFCYSSRRFNSMWVITS